MHDDLYMIKKKYGENMMHLCRALFPTILERKGLLFKLLSDNFAYSRQLYDDIVDNKLKDSFKNYIHGLSGIKVEYKENKECVEQLLDEVGYILYECHNEDDIQSFKKYYADGEVICTFKENRLDNCHVFFAVKKDVDDIKRKVNPKREDEYGTSVISIQFSRGETNTLSIKNRYNHTVLNSDATFSNNLDNINPGLTKAFEKQYDLNIDYNKTEFEMPGYIKANDGKYYKYNYEINNIYYCSDNIIIDNSNVKKYDKSNKIVLDYYILDLRDKNIKLYDKRIQDSLLETFNDIKKIDVKVDKVSNKKTISIDNDIDIILDKNNSIVEYRNSKIKEIDDNFMKNNIFLRKIDLSKVEKIGDCFLYDNKYLEQANLDNLKVIGSNCLTDNISLNKISLPKVEKVGGFFLYFNQYLSELNAPKLEKVDSGFLSNNRGLYNLDLPNLKHIEGSFLSQNKVLSSIYLPKVEFINAYFLANNQGLKSIDFPNLKMICSNFIWENKSIAKINLPKVEKIGDNFLLYNKKLISIDMPELTRVGRNFLHENSITEKVKFNKLKFIDDNFLYKNNGLKQLSLPSCVVISNYFMPNNEVLYKIEVPVLDFTGHEILTKNEKYKNVDLVELKSKSR